ncbi:MAG: TonB family protein, partial [Bacteroidota bacterium]
SPVSQPSTPAKPKPTPAPPRETTQPSPQPTETTNNNNSSSQAPPQEELEFTFESNSGSNQGNQSSGVGNQGTPDVKVLDPNGLYSFAEGGEGGLDGRRPLSLPEPRYTSQEEGRLTFELTIRPDGSVSYVKVVGVTNKASLKEAGINAIKRWRFSPLPPGSSQVTQRVRVSVTFKLRG